MGEPDQEQGGSRVPAIAGLAIAAVLLVAGLWLAHELTAASKMQDCVMSGRTNCNVIEPAR
ncbi:MAG: hypothetical protein WA303_15620 [Bradyrhizobium sp.]|jgi:hypothetical protein